MPSLPATIGRYQIRELLGHGGMGVLYLAFDPAIDRPVAVKVLRAHTEELYHRFTREARSAGRLQHPNIVTVYDVGEHDGQPFIAMEYIAGQTLAQVIAEGSALSLTRKLELLEELCDGLAYAHRAGIIHRDIKPSNLIINPDGLLKILDFGIARVADSGHTQAGAMIGTPNYMSPEQVRGQGIDLRSDVFAVGLVFYELLSYRQAFPGDSPFAVVQQILTDQPAPLSTVLPGLATAIVRIVDRALEKAPERRYQDLDLMRKDISRARDSLSGASLEDTAIITLPHREADSAGPASHPGSGKASRRTPLREELARRKTEQIEEHLRHAENALAVGHLEEALQAAEQAVFLDADSQRTMDALDRVRAAIDARQVREWLDQAKAELGAGALTSAESFVARVVELDPASEDAKQLGTAIVEARQRKEREAERLRQFQSLLARAKEALDKNEPAAALRAANDALQADPASTIAKDLHDKAEVALREYLDREAHSAIDQARKRFASGAHDDALAALASYTPEHPAVDAALTELRAELEAIRKRVAEEAAARRRAEEERKKREQALDAAFGSVVAAIGSEKFQDATARIEALAADDGLDETRKAELENARILLTERMALAKKRAGIEKFLGEARKQLAGGDFVKARAKVDAALALDANDAAVKKLAAEVEAARQAEEERKDAKDRDDRAASAVASARRLFADGKPEDALAMLRAYEDAHPAVAAGLAELVTAHETALKRAREEEEKKRRAAQAQAIAAAIDDARTMGVDGQHPEAIARLEAFRPQHPDIVSAIAELRAAAAQAEAERRQAEVRKRDETTRAALAEAEELAGQGDFDAALDRVDDALVENPTSRSAQDLRRRLARTREARAAEIKRVEHEAAAAAAIASAREAFERGDHDAALETLDRFTPPHVDVDATLAELRRARDEMLPKVAEEAAGPRAHDAKGRNAIERARRDFSSGRYAEAIQGLEAFSPPHELVTREIGALEQQQAEKVTKQRQQVETALDQARSLVTKGDLAGAQTAADRALAADREHVEARALRDDIAAKIVAEKRQQAREREAQQKASRIADLLKTATAAATSVAALKALDELLKLDPDHTEARRLHDERSAAAAIELAERDADAGLQTAMARARTLIDTGNGETAERMLRDSAAAYASSQALAKHQSAIDALVARARSKEPPTGQTDLSGRGQPRPDETVVMYVPPNIRRPQPPPEVTRTVPAPSADMDASATRVMLAPKRPAAPPPVKPSAPAPASHEEAKPAAARSSIGKLLLLLLLGLVLLFLMVVLLMTWVFGRSQKTTTTTTTNIGIQTTTIPATSTVPATSTIAATTTVVAATTISVPVQQAMRRLQEARRLRAEGHVDRALAEAEAGLKLDRQNRDLIDLASSIVGEAARMAEVGRRGALAARASGSLAFQQGDALSREAAAARDAGRFGEALKSWQTASARYETAIASATVRTTTIPVLTTTTTIPVTTTVSTTTTIPATTTVAGPSSELQAIGRQVLERYAQAYRSLDLDALARLYPDLPEYRKSGLQTDRRNCQSMDLTFGSVEWIKLEPATIEVRTSTSYNCRTRTGQRHNEVVVEGFVMKPTGGQWGITSMARYEK